MRAFSSRRFRVTILLLSPLLLNLWCERAVGPAPPVRARCADADGCLEVTAFQNANRPSASPIQRVTWEFRVGSAPRTLLYTFGVRQGSDHRLELVPPPPVHAPALTFHPTSEPFQFRIGGVVRSYWCTTATVEFMDGTVRRVEEFFMSEYATPPLGISILVSHQNGIDRADRWVAHPEPCPFP